MKKQHYYSGITFILLLLLNHPSYTQVLPLFDVKPQEGCIPLDLSICRVTNGAASYAWDFGDGRSATQRNPGPITYDTTGNFNITLTITTQPGHRLLKQIRVLAAPDDWEENPTELFNPDFYAEIYDEEDMLIYTSFVTWNQDIPSDVILATLLQPGKSYRVRIWDADTIGQSDFLGEVIIQADQDEGTVTAGPLSIMYFIEDAAPGYEYQLPAQTGQPVITVEGDQLIVETPFLSNNPNLNDYQWFLDGMPLENTDSEMITTSGPGRYIAGVNSAGGCEGFSEPYTIEAFYEEVETVNVVYGEGEEGDGRVNKIMVLEDSLFLVGGMFFNLPFLTTLDCNGEPVKAQVYSELVGGYGTIVDFLPKEDGSLVVTGECTHCVEGDSTAHIFFFKADAGTLAPDTAIGVKKIKATYEDFHSLFKNNYCNPCMLEEGGEYYGTARFLDALGIGRAYYFKLDAFLDLTWSQEINSTSNCFSESPKGIVRTENGIALLAHCSAGDSLSVFHFDLAGEILWEKRIHNNGVRSRSILYHPNGLLIIGGAFKEDFALYSDARLISMNASDGAIQEEFIFGEPRYDGIIDLKLLENGQLLAGFTYTQPTIFGPNELSRIYRIGVAPFTIVDDFDQIPAPDPVTTTIIVSLASLSADGTRFVSIGNQGVNAPTFLYTKNDCATLDDDQDGYSNAVDCNDADPDINPGSEEIANNEVDEDCDGVVLIIDEDMDGYNSDEDCNDQDPNIFPGAVEVPNNGIDEDCNGIDSVIVATIDLELDRLLKVFPNPTTGMFQLACDCEEKVRISIRHATGQVIWQKETLLSDTGIKVDLEKHPTGLYLIQIAGPGYKLLTTRRLVKIE